MLLTAVVDVTTDVIVGFDMSPLLDERAALHRLIHKGCIPPNSILLADRGYFSQSVWVLLNQCRIKAVLRVKKTACREVNGAVSNLQRTFRTSVFGYESQVTVWSARDDGILKGAVPTSNPPWCASHQVQSTPLHRYPTTHDWILLSNAVLPVTTAVSLYCMRWRVETVFRTLQTYLGLGLNRGKATSIFHTVGAACLAHTAFRLQELHATWTKRQRAAQNGDPYKAWTTSSAEHWRCLVKSTAQVLSQTNSMQQSGDRQADAVPSCSNQHRQQVRCYTLANALHDLIVQRHPLLYGLYAHAVVAHAHLTGGAPPLTYYLYTCASRLPRCLT